MTDEQKEIINLLNEKMARIDALGQKIEKLEVDSAKGVETTKAEMLESMAELRRQMTAEVEKHRTNKGRESAGRVVMEFYEGQKAVNLGEWAKNGARHNVSAYFDGESILKQKNMLSATDGGTSPTSFPASTAKIVEENLFRVLPVNKTTSPTLRGIIFEK